MTEFARIGERFRPGCSPSDGLDRRTRTGRTVAAVIRRVSSGLYSPVHLTPGDVSRFPRHLVCPVCAAPAPFEEILRIGNADWRDCVRLSQCEACHTLFYENPPPPEEMTTYYENVWNAGSGEPGIRAKARLKTKMRMARILAELGFTDRSAAILDVGCGVGDLMAGLRQAGFSDLWGTEVSRHRIAASAARFPGRVFQGGYEAVPEDRRFDVIYCNHVLEHIYEPAQAFGRMARLLDDDGVLIVTVPDAWSEPVSVQVLFLPHLHSFCARSFDHLAERHGLDSRFWTADRPWEMTAVFGKHLDRFKSAADFRRYSELEGPKDGSLRARVRAPWQGPSDRPRCLALDAIHKSRDPDVRLAGYRVLGQAERHLADARLAAFRMLRHLGARGVLGGNDRHVGYIMIDPQPEGSGPLILGAARPDALLQIK